jgi:hypothetical protein
LLFVIMLPCVLNDAADAYGALLPPAAGEREFRAPPGFHPTRHLRPR